MIHLVNRTVFLRALLLTLIAIGGALQPVSTLFATSPLPPPKTQSDNLGEKSNSSSDESIPQQSTSEKDEDRLRSLETLARGLYFIETLYFDPSKVEQEALITSALRGITAGLDPHTVYMPKEAFNQLTMDTQGKFGGVGVIVSPENGKLIVVSPIEDTPAYKAGIKAGDEIIEIDGDKVKEMKQGLATDKMRGETGSILKLAIKRTGTSSLLYFKLKREVINVQSVKSITLGGNILYTRISSFQENTAADLKKHIDKFQQLQKIKGLILDLRDNPGGLLDQAVSVSDLFIESGVIVSTVGRSKNDIEREFAHKRGTYPGFPMIVIINGGSASASEIVAGALQDHERALILGTTSFGKGSVQTLISLPDGSGLKITVARYYTPKDRSIQAKGIEPDLFVEQKAETREDSSPPKPSNSSAGSRIIRKESDLKGHIESEDLSDLAKRSGILSIVNNWPVEYRTDKQLISSYTYLHGWSIFNKKPQEQPAPKQASNEEDD